MEMNSAIITLQMEWIMLWKFFWRYAVYNAWSFIAHWTHARTNVMEKCYYSLFGKWTMLIMKLGFDFTKGDGIFLIYGNTYSLDLYMELLETMAGFLIQTTGALKLEDDLKTTNWLRRRPARKNKRSSTISKEDRRQPEEN